VKLLPAALSYPKLEKWIEMLIITVGAVIMGWLLNRDDPFFVQGRFPWIWFAPLLIALRYGIAPGMVSVSSICLLFLLMQRFNQVEGAFPIHFMLGGVLMTLVSGQFSALWEQRLRRANLLGSHASERFEQLSRAYFMVRLSHDRLEQNLISRPVTLRDAMIDLRALLASRGGELDNQTGAVLISILVHYCNLESASLYSCRDGRPLPEAVASCGRGAPLVPDDLMLNSLLEKGTTAYQSVARLPEDEQSAYLVAAPLRTSTGVLRALLLVSEMPFLSLQRETLQILGILLAYAADHAEAAEEAKGILAIFPDCPLMFAAELLKLVRIRRDLEVVSSLAVVTVGDIPQRERFRTVMNRGQRGLDFTWQRNLEHGVQFVTLMPFSGPAGVEGYHARLDSLLQQQVGIAEGEGAFSFHARQLSAEEPTAQLAEIFALVRT
jgi:hypothetical protein